MTLAPLNRFTTRLIIRTFIPRDAPHLNLFVQNNSDLLINTAPLTMRSNQSLSDSRGFIAQCTADRRNGFRIWNAILLREGSEYIGHIALTLLKDNRQKMGEIGYFIDRSKKGQGYATEALQVLMAYAMKELKLKKLQLRIHPANAASIRVAEKAGFQLKGLYKKDLQNFHGELIDSIYFHFPA